MKSSFGPALAAVLLSATAVAAQEPAPLYGDVRLEGGFYPDPWTLDLLAGGDRWAGELSDRCGGYVNSGPADFLLHFSQPVAALQLGLAAESAVSLVVRMPNGGWHCSGEPQEVARLSIGKPIPGTYEIWAGADSGFPDARLYISELQLPDEELRYGGKALDPELAGAARQRLSLDAALLDGSVTSLATLAGGPDPATSLSSGCAGSVIRSEPNFAFTLEEPLATLSLYGESEADTTLTVRTADGNWYCNDDSYGLNPAVTLTDLGAGEILAWMGLWGDGAEMQEATLHLRAGDPLWPAAEALQAVETARHGTVEIDPKELEPLNLPLTAGGPTAARELAPACSGNINPDAADLFVEVPEGLETLSLYATSGGDLTLLVVTPEGAIECNDDSYDLNPAVTLSRPSAGRYAVWIGTWSGTGLPAQFYAGAGEPQWDLTAAAAGAIEPGTGTPAMEAVLTEEMLDGRVTSYSVSAGGADAASGFSDSCVGSLDAANATLALTLEQPVQQLSIYAQSEADTALAVLTPDGVWHCNDDSSGLDPAVSLHDLPEGEILAWVAVWGGGSAEATLSLRAGEPQWAAATGTSQIEVDSSRNGTLTLDAVATTPLTAGFLAGGTDYAGDVATTCSGYIDTTAADVFVEVPEGLESLSLYATSTADLTLVVVGPDGRSHCNDDSYGLHPAVTLTTPEAGRYAVWVGTWSQRQEQSAFFAVAGEPQWDTAVPRLDLEGLSTLEALEAVIAFHSDADVFEYATADEREDGSLELLDVRMGDEFDQIRIARLLLREVDFQALETAEGIPSIVDVEMEGVDLADLIDDEEAVELFFGGEPPVIDILILHRYDEAREHSDLERLTLRLPGQMELTLRMAALGNAPTGEAFAQGMADPELLDLRIESTSLEISDTGWLRRTLAIAAAEEGTTIEALVEVGLAEMIGGMNQMGIFTHPEMQALHEAVSRFARENGEPRRLSISLAPQQPLEIGDLFLGMMDPVSLLDRLGLSSSYSAD